METKQAEQLLPLFEYTSCIVSFSTGIDSTGALYWALTHLDRRKTRFFLLYCDTGMEYDLNIKLFYKTAEKFQMNPVYLKSPDTFMELLMRRQKWPDMKNRWCTAYLKTGMSDKWIRANRTLLGEKCLFITGERREESPRRARIPDVEIHKTTLKTERKGKFLCHWFRPCLPYDKPTMFEMGAELRIHPHPCYEFCSRCSCMFCVFMSNDHALANMLQYPEKALEWVEAEKQIGHTWKQKTPLSKLWEQANEIWEKDCEDVSETQIII